MSLSVTRSRASIVVPNGHEPGATRGSDTDAHAGRTSGVLGRGRFGTLRDQGSRGPVEPGACSAAVGHRSIFRRLPGSVTAGALCIMPELGRELMAQLGTDCAAEPESTVSAGGDQRCYRWRCGLGWLLVKTVPVPSNDRLAGEAAGLSALAEAGALRVPRVRAQGIAAAEAFLALEWIDAAAASSDSERRLGEGLAALHHVTADRFGWNHDTHIGPTPQANGWLEDWPTFWRQRRLQPQLEWAMHRGHGRLLRAPGERLLEALDALLGDHRPQPSLLHGDLWGGNWCATADGEPVIFDPAVYYGDRETDLAMTRLFGGFGRRFYEAYLGSAPLPAGHAVRAELYNVYHMLNHANLFGGGYVQRSHAMIRRLLAQVSA